MVTPLYVLVHTNRPTEVAELDLYILVIDRAITSSSDYGSVTKLKQVACSIEQIKARQDLFIILQNLMTSLRSLSFARHDTSTDGLMEAGGRRGRQR